MLKKAFSLIELSIVILIIGIIVAGVTQSSRLLRQYQISAARTITQSSGVSSIKDLVLWLEPSMEGSITSATNGTNPENGDAVSAWNDYNPQTTQKINLSQSSSSKRPTYVDSGINSIPSISFDGTNDYLESTTAPLAAGYKNYTIFMVWRQSSSSGTQVIFHQKGPSCNGDYAGIYLSSSNINGWGCGSASTDYNNVSSYVTNKPYVTTYRVDNSQASNVLVYVNGTKYGPASKTLNLGASSVAAGYGGLNNYYFNGYISEIIVFARSLKDAEISDVIDYLSKKYKI